MWPADGEHVRVDVVDGGEDLLDWETDPKYEACFGCAPAVAGEELVGVVLCVVLRLVGEGRNRVLVVDMDYDEIELGGGSELDDAQ